MLLLLSVSCAKIALAEQMHTLILLCILFCTCCTRAKKQRIFFCFSCVSSKIKNKQFHYDWIQKKNFFVFCSNEVRHSRELNFNANELKIIVFGKMKHFLCFFYWIGRVLLLTRNRETHFDRLMFCNFFPF